MKYIIGAVAALVLVMVVALTQAQNLMFNVTPSPYGVEETAARIQANIVRLEGRGWKLSGLRNPAKAVAAGGMNVPPVLLVEACSTKYSGPLLKVENSRIYSILMPCTITVYKNDDGSTSIGTMNAGLMGKLFGIAEIMDEVYADQQAFIKFDPSRPAPPLIKTRPGGGGGGGKEDAGC
ncbi:MAG: DUF302 domain-containing protein [Gammaproteobacteria bacterium]